MDFNKKYVLSTSANRMKHAAISNKKLSFVGVSSCHKNTHEIDLINIQLCKNLQRTADRATAPAICSKVRLNSMSYFPVQFFDCFAQQIKLIFFHDFQHDLLSVNPIFCSLMTILAKRYRAKIMCSPAINPPFQDMMSVAWSRGSA